MSFIIPGSRKEPASSIAPAPETVLTSNPAKAVIDSPSHLARKVLPESLPAVSFPPERSRAVSPRAGFRILREDEKGVTLAIVVPPYRINKAGDEAGVSIPGYPSWGVPGEAALPTRIIPLPLPGVEAVEVRSLSSLPPRTETVKLSLPVVRAPTREEAEALIEDSILADPERLALLSDRERQLLEIKKELRESRGAVTEKADQNKEETGDQASPLVVAGSPYWKGDQQYVNLIVRPLRYQSEREQLNYFQEIEVEVKYYGQKKSRPPETKARFLRQYELAKSSVFKAEVSADDIHTLTYADLQAAGFPLTGDPRDLRVYYNGKEIAVSLQGEDDGSWDPGDYLDLYGRENTGFFSQTRVYWLEQTITRGERMEMVDASPSGTPAPPECFLSPLSLEENRIYAVSNPPTEETDYWFWDFAGVGWSAGTTFDLPDPASLGEDVPFDGWFFGVTEDESVNPDHHTNLYLNDQLIGDFLWDGKAPYHLETTVPQSYFNEGPNTLRLEEVGDTGAFADYIYLNKYQFSYWRRFTAHNNRLRFSTSAAGDYLISDFSGDNLILFDITRPSFPRLLVNYSVEGSGPYSLRFYKDTGQFREYLALRRSDTVTPSLSAHQPCDLTTRRRANYIAITPPEFSSALQPLLDLREQEDGIWVEEVNVQDAYDTFSFGEFNPHAIRKLLRYAHYHWKEVPPVYALLVGDGCYDYRNYLGNGKVNYIPPLLFASDYMQAPTDNRYACVVGKDHVPDLSIGRLSVTSAAEVTRVVQKIIDYEEGASGLVWQGKALLAADNPDAAGDFPTDSTWLGDNYLASFTRDTAYLPDLGIPATRTAIVDAFNSGRLIVNYLGHGANDRWSGDNIFNITTLSQLNNADRLPLMVTLTCLNGYWCDLSPCLAEAVANAEGKGAIVSFSPSGMCTNNNSKMLAAYLYEDLFSGGPRRLGPAVTEAKARLGGISSSLETMDYYHIFGDPALTLK